MENIGRTKFEYSTGSLIYQGVHASGNALTSDPNWEITKFTWDGTELVDRQILTGAWDDRVSLSW